MSEPLRLLVSDLLQRCASLEVRTVLLWGSPQHHTSPDRLRPITDFLPARHLPQPQDAVVDVSAVTSAGMRIVSAPCRDSPAVVAFLAAQGALELDACSALLAATAAGAALPPGVHAAERAFASTRFASRLTDELLIVLDCLIQAVDAALAIAPTADLSRAVQAFAPTKRALAGLLQQRNLLLPEAQAVMQRGALWPARRLAAALWAWHQQPEQLAVHRLALARAAAARSCAYLRCPNLAGEGGPAAGQGAGSSKCSGCREAW